jgi:Fe-S cluster assembly scaffold protein SufB
MTEQIIYVKKDQHIQVPLEWYGKDTQNHLITVMLEEEGASCEVVGVFLGLGSETFTSNTTVVHAAPKTFSTTLLRGVLRDSSQAYVRGMVKILPGAKGSKAGFEARALMLSTQAKAECVPDLEISENDVLGATHAASVGPVDEEQLFYLMARGLSRIEAQELLTDAFVWPVLEKLGKVSVTDA